MGYTTYQLVQDFSHQQNGHTFLYKGNENATFHDFIHQKLRNKHKQNDFISYYFSIFPILTYKIWKTATIYTFSIYIYDINSTAGDSNSHNSPFGHLLGKTNLGTDGWLFRPLEAPVWWMKIRETITSW